MEIVEKSPEESSVIYIFYQLDRKAKTLKKIFDGTIFDYFSNGSFPKDNLCMFSKECIEEVLSEGIENWYEFAIAIGNKKLSPGMAQQIARDYFNLFHTKTTINI